ncbi:MAG TPA: hypothetical protein VJJ21_02700 [Candidatus Nanoarchaeia archaeon]|nr:hypothetical protein [Candidatus Nanoarchaeia archaeon]
MEHAHARENKQITTGIEKVILALFVISLVLIVFNQFQLFSVKNAISGGVIGIGDAGAAGNAGNDGGISSGVLAVQAAVIPKGVPEIYGSELNIKYDDVNANDPGKADETIKILANLDRTLTLEGKNKERYVTIASQISCEYCCGAKSIIFTKDDIDAVNKNIDDAIAAGKVTSEEAKKYRQEAGGAACGCAHSYAMRGLAKYLLLKHGNEYSDDQILEELGKWKTLFFPGNIQAKAEILKQKGIELNYINLASNKYRGIEQGQSSSGAMVGGC